MRAAVAFSGYTSHPEAYITLGYFICRFFSKTNSSFTAEEKKNPHHSFPFYGWPAQLSLLSKCPSFQHFTASSFATADSPVLGQVKFSSTSNQQWFMALVMMKFHLSHSRSLRRLLIKQHSISPSSSATYSATSSLHPTMKLKGAYKIAWLWCTILCYIFCSSSKHLSPGF